MVPFDPPGVRAHADFAAGGPGPRFSRGDASQWVSAATVLVAVRISPAESAVWRAKAAAAGVPLSALLRRAMARTRTWTAPAAKVERERTRQVVRIGNNLNQVARWASGVPKA